MLIVGAALVTAAAAAHAGQAPRPDNAFGFEPGEERRYKLGPPDSLAPGEFAEWTLRFDRFDYPAGETHALFEFSHERFERIPGGTFTGNAEVMAVSVEGRLKVNLAGFPLLVEYTQHFVYEGEEMDNTGRRRVRFEFDRERDRYEKTIKVGSKDWDFRFGVPKQRHLDLDVPRGLYMFLPGSLGCLGDSRIICIELEPALANPGLLSLAFPALEEMEDAEREFLFLMPVSLSASPFVRVTAGPWLSHERDQFSNRQRYFEFMKLKLQESQEVEVGPRTMHAWKVDMCCGIDQAWVEPGGRVLRVDLDTTMSNSADRWIRYIFPFEEFLSPNKDPKLQS